MKHKGTRVRSCDGAQNTNFSNAELGEGGREKTVPKSSKHENDLGV